MPKKSELKQEAIRLRVEERLSLREIEAMTGASKGSLSLWLRPYPLTKEELKSRGARGGHPNPAKHIRPEPSKYYLMRKEGLSTLQTGKIAETAVLLRLILLGFQVYGSPFDGDRVDWVVEVGDKMMKLQVRSCRYSPRGGSPAICLTRTLRGGRTFRFLKGDFDFLVGYDLLSDTAYVYSWEEVEHLKKMVSVTPEAVEAFEKMNAPGKS